MKPSESSDKKTARVSVLLVEQENEIISAVSDIVSEIRECQLRISTSLADALLAILEETPGLLLFAHGLPGRNSLEVFSSIRTKYPAIELIVLLSAADQHLSEEYKNAGALQVVVKNDKNGTPLGTAVKEAVHRILGDTLGVSEVESVDYVPSKTRFGEGILHYRVLQAIGEGGMGQVFKAEDLKLGRLVAIKALPEAISSNEQSRRRFVREAQLASRLNHPGIVTIHAIEEVNGVQFIVMEYLEGQSLRDLISEGPLEWNRLVSIGTQIANALEAAHAAGLIHRDVKPANIMISAQDRVKILDFGLAKSIAIPDVNTETASLTAVGAIVGTAAYMSPEQTRGDQLDYRTDLFSLGSVLYHASTGKMPFSGPTMIGVLHDIATKDHQPPSNLNSRLPSGFDAFLQRAMAKDKNLRFSSARQMATELTQLHAAPAPRISQKDPDSIAVLYFENLGGLAEQEYLRDGLTEDVITELSKLETLQVFPRSAVAEFRDKPVAAPEIGRQLRASYVLAGSLRKSGNRVRVTAQLIRSESGHSIWAERYDRELQDVFDLQDEIARSLASALSIKLTPRQEKAIAQKPFENPEAYDFYLQGRRLFRRGTRKEFESAGEMFQRAIAIAPNFALAFAGLGHVCGRIHRYHDQDPKWMQRGIEACDTAIRLEPNQPDAFSARAFLLYGHKQYEESIFYAKRALEHKQDCECAYFALGLALNVTDRVQEACDYADAAVQFNGDDYNTYVPYVHSFVRIGNEEKAEQLRQQHSKVLQLHLEWAPENARARILLASRYADAGEERAAIEELEKALVYSPDDASNLYNAACAYALLGKKSEALNTLNRAIQNGYRHADTIARETDFKSLRGEPQFQEILRRLR